MRIGFLHSLLRRDEKLLIDEFARRPDVELEMVDDRHLSFDLARSRFDFDAVVERSINHSRALHALRLFEMAGVRCVNTSHTAAVCGDKLLTSVVLQEQGIPQPAVR
ncbi:MAG TPA: lysine biosynthesis protein LysX, partial [Candidatus Aminicenantes bacterium]|nr:lysine biosynthesis protein LysX [Candidatus Aminicenantes bacterium]